MKMTTIVLFCVGMLSQSTGLAIMARYPYFKWRVNAYGFFILGMALTIGAAITCFQQWR